MRMLEILLFFCLMFFCIYQFVIWVLSIFFKASEIKPDSYYHKFMAVIPARNEEKVIENLIKSIKVQSYPNDLIDIYVIADNCTDKTAELAKKAGAIVFERTNELEKGKGYALNWFFDIVLARFSDKYDAFCIFDADNIVSSNFFSIMNQKLCNGEVIVQGYRDIKNPYDNWISSCYALFYWSINKCYHFARYKLGLSPLINGTGFMVSMSIIKEDNGWHTETLTEDIEFSLNHIAKGQKIGWSTNAIVYDEQPTSFKTSWNQRMRWSVGHIQCLKTCLPKLLKSKEITPTIIDAIIYILGMPLMLVSVMLTLRFSTQLLLFPDKYILSLLSKFQLGIITALIIMTQLAIIVIIDHKNLRKMWKGIATYPLFLLSWFMINILAFFKQNMTWAEIKHTKTIEIQDIQ